MDLFKDADGLLRGHLDSKGVDHSSIVSFEELLHAALKLQLKSVAPKPRIVFRSPDFDAKLAALSQGLRTAADEIIAKVTKGEDLSGHLSRDSVDPAKEDGLLTHWAFHHVHISVHKADPRDQFFARSGPLMFVIFDENEAYLTDIHPHRNAWTRVALLEIAQKNWPSAFESSHMKGIAGLGWNAPTEEDFADLRKGRVNTTMMINGAPIFSPGGGVMSSGVPLKVVRAADRVKDGLQELGEILSSVEGSQLAEWAVSAGISVHEMDFDLRDAPNGGWAVYVAGTGYPVFTIPNPLRI
jgi:hypothetical protein